MKTTCIVAIVALLAACKPPPPPEPPEPRQVSQQEVEAAILAMEKAWLGGDKVSAAKMVDQSALMTWPTGRVEGRETMLKLLEARPEGAPVPETTYSNWQLRQVGSVVIAKYDYESRTTGKDGQVRAYGSAETSVLEDREGMLVLISSHSTEIPKRARVEVAQTTLDSYAGKYLSDSSGATYEVTAQDGKLMVGPVDKPELNYEWLATSDTEFYFPGSRNTLEFLKAENGKVTGYVYHVGDNPPSEAKKVE